MQHRQGGTPRSQIDGAQALPGNLIKLCKRCGLPLQALRRPQQASA